MRHVPQTGGERARRLRDLPPVPSGGRGAWLPTGGDGAGYGVSACEDDDKATVILAYRGLLQVLAPKQAKNRIPLAFV